MMRSHLLEGPTTNWNDGESLWKHSFIGIGQLHHRLVNVVLL